MMQSDDGDIQASVVPSWGITLLIAVTLGGVLVSLKIVLEAIH